MFDRILASPSGGDSAQADRRDNRRMAVAMTGMLTGGGWDDEVSIVNLSASGAMIETGLPLRVDERSVLSIDGWGPVLVIVRWVGGGRAGLEFER